MRIQLNMTVKAHTLNANLTKIAFNAVYLH